MINSVRVRLTLWYVAVFGLVLAGFSVFVYLVLSQSLYERLDQSLSRADEVVAGELRSEIAEHNGDATAGAVQTLTELHLSGTLVAMFDGERLLASNFEDDRLSPNELLSATPLQ